MLDRDKETMPLLENDVLEDGRKDDTIIEMPEVELSHGKFMENDKSLIFESTKVSLLRRLKRKKLMRFILLVGIFVVLVSLALGGLTERLGGNLEKRQVDGGGSSGIVGGKGGLGGVIGEMTGRLTGAVGDVVGTIGEMVGGLVGAVGGLAGNISNTLTGAVNGTVHAANGAVNGTVNAVNEAIGNVVDAISETTGDVVDAISNNYHTIKDKVAGLFGGGKTASLLT